MKQIVAHKKLGALRGILLVLGLVAALVLLNYFVLALLVKLLGDAAGTISMWCLGGLLAWQVLRIYIVAYAYEMDDEVLRLSRKYGKRERIIEDIYLSRLLFVGAPDEAKKRYPDARRVSAVHAGVKDGVTAVVFQNSLGTRIALAQLNPEFRQKLISIVKKG